MPARPPNKWNPKEAESLDQDFQQSSHFAGKQCKKKPNINFLKQLALLWVEKNSPQDNLASMNMS